jgi:N6-adenosine-specific RNA methylase IME4/ParB-like chromosome segregation protein Spo0J
MATIGLLHPIVVDETGRLIAGLHRVEAAKSLGWKTIKHLTVRGLDEDAATLAEIDENLMRADLSPAENAIHVAERKRIYLKMHPETASTRQRGGPGRGKKNESQNAIRLDPAFVDDAAAKTGKHRATVARAAARGENIVNIADCIGTSLDKGDELDALAKLPEQRQATIIARAVAGERVSAKPEAKRGARAEKERLLAEVTKAASAEVGQRLYGVIYADPPWRFEPYSRETGMDRAADNHYPTMDLDGIKAMAVPAAPNCVLFLWATAPMLPEALSVMEAWGFTYKSHCVWVKDRIGTGYWFRNKHELLLVGTRGDKVPAPAPGEQFDSVIDAMLAEHSRKPHAFAEMIEEMFPNVPAVEMFARGQRLGWDVWGNEAS